PSPVLFPFPSPRHHRALPSFPTRRSSDLAGGLVRGCSWPNLRPLHHPPPLAPVLPPQELLRLRGVSDLQRLRVPRDRRPRPVRQDRKSTRLNSSHVSISYAVFCLKKKKN